MRGFSLGAGLGNIAPAAVTPPPSPPPPPTEAWVQPAFDASTGITLGHDGGSSDPVISGGRIGFPSGGSAYAYATALVPITAGTWRVVALVTATLGEDAVNVLVGAASFDDSTAMAVAALIDPTNGSTQTLDIVITSGDITGQLISIYDNNGSGVELTSLSVTKIA